MAGCGTDFSHTQCFSTVLLPSSLSLFLLGYTVNICISKRVLSLRLFIVTSRFQRDLAMTTLVDWSRAHSLSDPLPPPPLHCLYVTLLSSDGQLGSFHPADLTESLLRPSLWFNPLITHQTLIKHTAMIQLNNQSTNKWLSVTECQLSPIQLLHSQLKNLGRYQTPQSNHFFFFILSTRNC